VAADPETLLFARFRDEADVGAADGRVRYYQERGDVVVERKL
jgi:hypothetical protein